HHRAGEQFDNRPDCSNQLLVAASPSDRVSDTHWYRPDFDHFLQREAVATGAEYLDHTLLDSIGRQPDGTWVLGGTRHVQPVRIRARFMVDATGPRGFLSRALNLPAV